MRESNPLATGEGNRHELVVTKEFRMGDHPIWGLPDAQLNVLRPHHNNHRPPVFGLEPSEGRVGVATVAGCREHVGVTEETRRPKGPMVWCTAPQASRPGPPAPDT